MPRDLPGLYSVLHQEIKAVVGGYDHHQVPVSKKGWFMFLKYFTRDLYTTYP
jgi:hypothetical protein